MTRTLLAGLLAVLLTVCLGAEQSPKPVMPIAPAVAHGPAVMNAASQAELVKQSYFVGLNLEEIASLLGVSARTADRDLAYAKAWLGREILRLR